MQDLGPKYLLYIAYIRFRTRLQAEQIFYSCKQQCKGKYENMFSSKSVHNELTFSNKSSQKQPKKNESV